MSRYQLYLTEAPPAAADTLRRAASGLDRNALEGALAAQANLPALVLETDDLAAAERARARLEAAGALVCIFDTRAGLGFGFVGGLRRLLQQTRRLVGEIRTELRDSKGRGTPRSATAAAGLARAPGGVERGAPAAAAPGIRVGVAWHRTSRRTLALVLLGILSGSVALGFGGWWLLGTHGVRARGGAGGEVGGDLSALAAAGPGRRRPPAAGGGAGGGDAATDTRGPTERDGVAGSGPEDEDLTRLRPGAAGSGADPAERERADRERQRRSRQVPLALGGLAGVVVALGIDRRIPRPTPPEASRPPAG